MNFDFATAGRILFGPGTLQQAGALTAALGKRALVVAWSTAARSQPLLDLLDKQGVDYAVFSVGNEPTVDNVRAGVEAARALGAEVLVAMGGGSVIDTAKAIAGLLANPGDPFDYLEVIGRAQPLARPAAPVIAIPTTAGTGSEVTRNAVLASPEHGVKVSLRSPHMLPRVALVDPLLTHSVPRAVTASTGLDALTQLIEPYVSAKANAMTDAICRSALPLAMRALPRVCADGSDAQAREEMSFASLCGGLALANAGLGAVHGIAGPFGGEFHAPHGAVCAALLPSITAVNVAALEERAPAHPALARYAELAALATGDPAARPADLAAWLGALVRSLDIPPLSAYSFGAADMDGLIPKVLVSSSMKGNPLPLTADELRAALEQAM